MAKSELPPISELRQRLRYEPETGRLYWLRRDSDERYDRRFNRQYAGKEAGYNEWRGYLRVWINGRSYQGHRVAWALHYGERPTEWIDHIDGDPRNNRIDNLRLVTPDQNAQNQAMFKTNSTGYGNVRPCSRIAGKWFAAFDHKKQNYYLGRFDSPEAANEAVRAKQAELGFLPRHGAARNGEPPPVLYPRKSRKRIS